jgi:DNA polymerase IV
VFVRGHFEEYQRLADQVMAVLGDSTPDVERVSIDEAFLDVRGAIHLFGSPGTKHLAKVASQIAKPDGLVVVESGSEASFLAPLPVRLIWGVGPVTGAKLAARGIATIGDLAATSSRSLRHMLGSAAGGKLSDLSHDRGLRAVSGPPRARSVGAQSAFGSRAPTRELIREVIGHLADQVTSRIRAKRLAGRTVTVRVRLADLRAVTRALTLPAPVSATLTLTEVAEQMAWQAIRDERANQVDLLGISVSKLAPYEEIQLELPLPPPDPRRPGSTVSAARAAVDEVIDVAREWFGRSVVGYLPAQLLRQGGVPDTFRELAEREL